MTKKNDREYDERIDEIVEHYRRMEKRFSEVKK